MRPPPAVLVDCYCNPIKAVELCGRSKSGSVLPFRIHPLDTSGPHRQDWVERVFELDGTKSADGEWIYRETHWRTLECRCSDNSK